MAPSLLYSEGGCQSLKGKIEFLLERADDNLESIQLLIVNDYHDIAVSRSYYATFTPQIGFTNEKFKIFISSGVVS
ncbi:hypothetical protein DSECCO2_602290 [anaerobic digester metagenome]